MLFDTHAHYDDGKIFDEAKLLFEKAHSEGITKITNVADCLDSAIRSVNFAKEFGYVYCTSGVHPQNCVKDMQNSDWLDIIQQHTLYSKCVAIGEIGLDYYYGTDDKAEQKKCFEEQMQLASKLHIPVIIHDRDAHADILDIIKKYPSVTGVVHSYSGSQEMLKELIKLGYYFSVNGVVTFKNARKICEIIENLRNISPDALSRLLLETDAPYLTPEPNRGKVNYSGYMLYTAKRVSELAEIPYEELCDITYSNSLSFYSIKD